MIDVSTASKIILSNTKNYGTETVALINSLQRILAEDIVADREFPPFDRVCMDGIAINFKAFEAGKTSFLIEGVQAAGSPQMELKSAENCLEVMTGAILPKGTDAVIMYELVTIENGVATLNTDQVTYFQNIHHKGKDRKQNDLLISKGKQITAAEIGVLATVGKSEVVVVKNPKVLIVSTGDELVEVSETPLDYQIRRSNVYSLQALLLVLGIPSETAHLKDDKVSLTTSIKSALDNYDVLLFSGAVSKGKFDYIPEVLDALGVEKLFHRVKQRPGKPFWFGKNNAGKMVFAFPGNPVSTYVNCLKYFYPWYYTSVLGKQPNVKTAVLSEDFSFKPTLTYFLQVKLCNENGVLVASPVIGNGSGDLANLTEADGFIELPAEEFTVKKGTQLPVLKYRRMASNI